MKQRISTVVGTLIIIVMVLTAGAFLFKASTYDLDSIYQSIVNNPAKSKKTDKVACTMEAKLCPDGTYVSRSGPNCEFAACPESGNLKDKIIISAPEVNQEISSPVSVSGQARGGWFFEGTFPVEVYDSNDKFLGLGPATFMPKNASDTWMTDNFVDFKGKIKFSEPTTDWGYVLFKKDNPSGNPAMDESLRLDVKFKPGAAADSWKNYKNEQYGFELTFPQEYKGYKVITKNENLDKGVLAYIYVDIPTSDKNWPGDIDPKTGKSLKGYASVFAITVWNAKEYGGVLNSCKNDPNPGCPAESSGVEPLAKNEKYVFDISGPQAGPKDLNSITSYTTVGKTFKLIN